MRAAKRTPPTPSSNNKNNVTVVFPLPSKEQPTLYIQNKSNEVQKYSTTKKIQKLEVSLVAGETYIYWYGSKNNEKLGDEQALVLPENMASRSVSSAQFSKSAVTTVRTTALDDLFMYLLKRHPTDAALLEKMNAVKNISPYQLMISAPVQATTVHPHLPVPPSPSTTAQTHPVQLPPLERICGPLLKEQDPDFNKHCLRQFICSSGSKLDNIQALLSTLDRTWERTTSTRDCLNCVFSPEHDKELDALRFGSATITQFCTLCRFTAPCSPVTAMKYFVELHDTGDSISDRLKKEMCTDAPPFKCECHEALRDQYQVEITSYDKFPQSLIILNTQPTSLRNAQALVAPSGQKYELTSLIMVRKNAASLVFVSWKESVLVEVVETNIKMLRIENKMLDLVIQPVVMRYRLAE